MPTPSLLLFIINITEGDDVILRAVYITALSSLCVNGPFNLKPLVSGEQVKCVFLPTFFALPGIYRFELEVQNLLTSKATISKPSSPIVVNPVCMHRL